MAFGGSGSKLPKQKEDTSYVESEDMSAPTADAIYQLVDSNLQQSLAFGDEFYDLEVLEDLTLKFVVAGDANVDAHSADAYDFDNYSAITINSDVDDAAL